MRIGESSRASKGKAAVSCVTQDSLQHAQKGSIVERWGWFMEVDDDIVLPETFEKEWRTRGDSKADAVVRRLKIGKGVDALEAIEEYLAAVPEPSWDDSVREFWLEVARPPPTCIAAHRLDSKGVPIWTPQAAIDARDRHPAPSLDEGQALFHRYCIELAGALLSFSLAAGFSSQRLMATLQETGYLTSKNRDVTYRRLLETYQFVLDAMRDMEPATGKGWRSAVRVRLLHAQIRVRISEGHGKLGLYSVERDGIPINQEDLAATLAGFCVAPLWACRRLKVGLTQQEEMAYVAAWRHIGFYLGIEASILERHFTRLSAAEKFLACAAWHLFANEDAPPDTDPYSTTTMRVLEAVTNRPPQASSLLYHVEMARRTLGPGLARRLALPDVPIRVRLQARYRLFLIRCFRLFGRYYRKEWDVRRARLMFSAMLAVVAWQLGQRRTKFVAKEAEPKESEADVEEVDVQLGVEAGRAMLRSYRALIGEMILVVACIGLVLVAVTWWTWSHTLKVTNRLQMYNRA